MPELLFDSLDAVPEGLREVAVQEGEKVKVNVVPKVRLDEFRENNVKLVKERDDLSSRVGKVKTVLGTEDLDAFAKELGDLRSVASRVKDGQLVENKGLEEALSERTRQMRESYDSEVQKAAKEAAGWRDKFTTTSNKLRQTYIDRALTDVVLDETNGLEPKALIDIVARAARVFEVGEDGKLTPKNGDAVVYGADGVTPMTPKEWVLKLKEEAPYFFKGSNGGGAGGGDQKKVGGYSAAELAKMTPEMRLRVANGEKVPNLA